MSKYYWSASKKSFYVTEDDGSSPYDLPSDIIPLTYDEWQGLLNGQSTIGPIENDENGRPYNKPIDTGGKTNEQYEAEAQKTYYLNYATQKIAPLQDAVDLDMATDEEKSQLLAWKKYRVLVNRVDTSTAPNITWPTSPDDESTTSSSTATTTGDATAS